MRYSDCSLAYQFAAIFGGMTPLICATVAMTVSVYSVAAFIMVLAMLSFACSFMMTETLPLGLRNDKSTRPLRSRRPSASTPSRDGVN